MNNLRIKKNILILVQIIILLCTACTKEKTNSFNGTTKYIQKFTQEQALNGEKLSYINSIGFYGCDLVYPYLLLNLSKQDSLIGIYNIEEKKLVGNLFSIGQGPEEFNSFTIVNQHKDSLLWVNDIYKHELKAIDLDETINSKLIVCEKTIKYDSYPNSYIAFWINDSSIWVKSYTKEKEITYNCSDSAYSIRSLYKEKITMNDLNNIMPLADALKEDGSKIVSLTGILDQIDILSLTSDNENISVTTSDKLTTIKELQNNNYKHATDYYLSLPRCNNQYIIALHISQKTKKKELHLIDWQGNGLRKYHLNEDIIDFCIDWRRGIVYGVTSAEEVYKYTINFPQ